MVDRPRLPAGGEQGDRDLRRPPEGPRLRAGDVRRHLDRHQGHGDPGRQAQAARRGAHGRARDRGPVQQGPDHRRRALQQGGRHLGRGDGPDRGRDAARARHPGGARPGRQGAPHPVLQPDLHDGRLGGARLGAADPAAGRHARPDGQALGRDHRDPHHRQLPRGSHRAAVLHLDARRAQGSRRHGAQDRQLGLSDAPPGRRGAGLDHPGGGLRHARRHRDFTAGRGRRGDRGYRRPCAGTGGARGHPRPVLEPCHRAGERGDQRGQGRRDRGRRARACEDPLRAHLPVPAGRVRQVLRPRPGARPHGEPGRGDRRHRRAVDRRAGHAADHADVPHRRHGEPARRADHARGAQRGLRQVHQPGGGRGQGRRPDRDEQAQRRGRDRRLPRAEPRARA